jgi:integrase
MGHASITVTAHTYADLFDDERDHIATRSTMRLAQPAADPVWPHFVRFLRGRRAAKTGLQHVDLYKQPCGQGRDRTGDLPLFRRTLVPTELPGPEGTGHVVNRRASP